MLAVLLVSCVVCVNGTQVVPGSWFEDKEMWATLWSHQNPNLRRKMPEPVIGDGYDRRQPDTKPRMFRSAAQQAAQLGL